MIGFLSSLLTSPYQTPAPFVFVSVYLYSVYLTIQTARWVCSQSNPSYSLIQPLNQYNVNSPFNFKLCALTPTRQIKIQPTQAHTFANLDIIIMKNMGLYI